jgi:hypothetical protein
LFGSIKNIKDYFRLIRFSKYAKKAFLNLLLLFAMNSILKAQETQNQSNKNWRLSIGVFLNSDNVNDKNFSSLKFSGNTLGYFSSIKYQKEKISHEMQFYYTKGILSTKIYPFDKLSQAYFNADYINLYSIFSSNDGSVTFRGGGGINILYAERNYENLINNNFSYEFAASLSGVMEVSYFFGNKQSGFSVTDRLCVPLVSSAVQPSFGSDNVLGYINQNNFSLKDNINNSHVVFFSSFIRLVNNIKLEKNISANQKISLNYCWDYYRLNTYRQVIQSNSRLGLIYCLLF